MFFNRLKSNIPPPKTATNFQEFDDDEEDFSLTKSPSHRKKQLVPRFRANLKSYQVMKSNHGLVVEMGDDDNNNNNEDHSSSVTNTNHNNNYSFNTISDTSGTSSFRNNNNTSNSKLKSPSQRSGKFFNINNNNNQEQHSLTYSPSNTSSNKFLYGNNNNNIGGSSRHRSSSSSMVENRIEEGENEDQEQDPRNYNNNSYNNNSNNSFINYSTSTLDIAPLPFGVPSSPEAASKSYYSHPYSKPMDATSSVYEEPLKSAPESKKTSTYNNKEENNNDNNNERPKPARGDSSRPLLKGRSLDGDTSHSGMPYKRSQSTIDDPNEIDNDDDDDDDDDYHARYDSSTSRTSIVRERIDDDLEQRVHKAQKQQTRKLRRRLQQQQQPNQNATRVNVVDTFHPKLAGSVITVTGKQKGVGSREMTCSLCCVCCVFVYGPILLLICIWHWLYQQIQFTPGIA